ncbi:MAG: RHS repeat-associated core domain-containing protein [Myxococcota bacterium]
MRLTYDPFRRLASASTPSGSVSYGYDANARRVRPTVAGEDELFHLEGEHLEAVYDGSGQLRASYLRGRVIDEVVNGYLYNAQGQRSNHTFFHDPVQSVVALGNHNAGVDETYAYLPFGEQIGGSSTTANTLRYTGREYDAVTGLYHYRARTYDPTLGRFLSEDPLGFEAGVNFYAYVGRDSRAEKSGQWFHPR